MNFLVLGGAGFIGSHVVDSLLAAGHRVRVLEHPQSDLGNLAHVRSRIELRFADFANGVKLRQLLPDYLNGVDQVIHLVSTVLPALSNKNPLYDIETNLKSTVVLLEEVVKSGVKKVVFASTGGQIYGPATVLPIAESNSTDPLSSYGIIKLAIEKYLKLFHHLHGLDYTILRIANPYGERQRIGGAQGAVAVFLGHLKNREPIEIWGDGSVARDYLYIADLVDVVLRASAISNTVKLFNIGSGRSLSLNELIAMLTEVSGLKVDVIYRAARPCDSPVNFLDSGLALKHLDWEPQVSLKDGLKRTWKWVLANA
ncbi:MAG: NAD-dependent epimerase/dehydratase family protein [Desulfuromusa sp.]|nr:NAD-dependent epimerase/dehydratase family protein [Desulfuromusa sp.]